LGRASELPIGREDSPIRRRVGLSDVLWIAAIFVWWLVLLLWFPFLTNATLTRFSAGAFRLAVWEGAAMGGAVFLAVRFAGAPRLLWVGVAIPATLAIVILALLRLVPNSPIGGIGWGYYLYGIALPSAVCAVCAYLFSALPRRTPEWSRDD
jgi:hypothetical protein